MLHTPDNRLVALRQSHTLNLFCCIYNRIKLIAYNHYFHFMVNEFHDWVLHVFTDGFNEGRVLTRVSFSSLNTVQIHTWQIYRNKTKGLLGYAAENEKKL